MLIFRDKTRDSEMRPVCDKVLQQFDLPKRSLVCIFDDQERPGFLQHPEIGVNFCGFFSPIRQSGIGNGVWAPELVTHVWDTGRRKFAYDAAIYLRKRTCDALTGMVTWASQPVAVPLLVPVIKALVVSTVFAGA